MKLLSRRFLIYMFLVIVALTGFVRLYYRLTDDFRLSNIRHQLADTSRWQAPILSSEEHAALSSILQQKFYYIGKGAQCYAFVGEDQQYVLKFFKFKHLRSPAYLQCLPPVSPFKEYRQAVAENKLRKLIGVFDGYDLAYRKHKDESALLYLHLIPTTYLKRTVKVVDKIGLTREIDLDETVFLLQRKGETLRTRLNRQLANRQLDEAKKSIADIVAMYIKEYEKGLYDRDHGVMHNTGFVQDRPFHLDVGKFSQDDRMRQVDVYKKDLEHILWKIDTWIKANYADDYPNFTSFLSEQHRFYTRDLFDGSSIDPKRFKKKKH